MRNQTDEDMTNRAAGGGKWPQKATLKVLSHLEGRAHTPLGGQEGGHDPGETLMVGVGSKDTFHSLGFLPRSILPHVEVSANGMVYV